LKGKSGGFQTDGLYEPVEIVNVALVKAVELRSVLVVQGGVALDGG
jgi:hypothetical protein